MGGNPNGGIYSIESRLEGHRGWAIEYLIVTESDGTKWTPIDAEMHDALLRLSLLSQSDTSWANARDALQSMSPID